MIEDYVKAKRIGDRQVHRAIAQGRYPYPPALDDLIETGLSEYPVGLKEIPVDMIAGTKTAGRQNAFSSGFMPILREKSEFAIKWSNLYDSQLEEGIHEPIKAYEYMRRFYVQEGNKRVSVTKYVNMPMIHADITRILPRRTDDKDVKIYYEFLDFYEVCPLYSISFSEEGCYAQLAELLGKNLKQAWSQEEVENLRSAFFAFSKVYEEKNQGKLSITAGDALLMYLKIYRLSDILESPRARLVDQVSSIWNELLVANQDDDRKIALVETPKEIAGLENEVPTASSAGSILSMLRGQTVYSEKNPLRVAFFYDKSPEQSGWIYGHELGRNQLEQDFPGLVETVRYDHIVTNKEFAKAVYAAVMDENHVIITTSPAMMDQTFKAAIDHPEIKFLNCSVNLSHNAVRTYYGRMYEAKFLMGALAASMADNHKIGYRADYPIYGTIANINAFAIGAALVDPKAEVVLSWDSVRNSDWKAAFAAEDVKVCSGLDMIKPREASREYGLYMYEDGMVKNLAMPVWDWGQYYKLIVRTILNGTWSAKNLSMKDQALNYWWGMEAGVIDVILSEKLTYHSKKLVNLLKQGVISGSLNPFDGELRSKEGVIKTADAPRLSNEEIITMDWLADNVIGRIPTIDELNERAKETVLVSGVAATGQEKR